MTSNVQIELLRTLEVGDTIYWTQGESLRITGRSERFIIASNEEELSYSIIDLKRKVCGASDRVFDMFDYYTEEGAQEVLKHLMVEPKFEVDYTDDAGHDVLKRVDDEPDIFKMEVSYRHNCPISEGVDFSKTFNI